MFAVGSSLKRHARAILEAGIQEVQPDRLLPKWIRRDGDVLSVGDMERMNLHRNVYVVGFGKAVGGMARSLQGILGLHLVKGIVSVPIHTRDTVVKLGRPEMLPIEDDRFEVREGAQNNLPDEASLASAKAIVDMISHLQPSDVLFVLTSGGGSALLPLPLEPITLREKLDTIRLLANSGARIDELNYVRKRLSAVKGGRLLGHTRAKVISLIISDIVDDPLDFIASGPTVPNQDDVHLPLKILDKYKVTSRVCDSVIHQLRRVEVSQPTSSATNLIIGNNGMAVEAACREAEKLGYNPHLLTKSLQGEARRVGQALAEVAVRFAGGGVEKNWQTLADELCVTDEKLLLLSEEVRRTFKNGQSVCIVAGGETTVHVTGSGSGGRNQEMALAAAVHWEKRKCNGSLFLSAGTDGIDGPTDAAGAIVFPETAAAAREQGLDCAEFLENNDSYTFFKKLNGGADHVITGPTGTNVMDLQILLLVPKVNKASL